MFPQFLRRSIKYSWIDRIENGRQQKAMVGYWEEKIHSGNSKQWTERGTLARGIACLRVEVLSFYMSRQYTVLCNNSREKCLDK